MTTPLESFLKEGMVETYLVNSELLAVGAQADEDLGADHQRGQQLRVEHLQLQRVQVTSLHIQQKDVPLRSLHIRT